MALIKRFKNEEKTKDAVEIVEKYPRNRGVGGEMKAAGKMASKWFGAGSQLELGEFRISQLGYVHAEMTKQLKPRTA